MKTLRMIGAMALCAVIAPAVTSCGDDDKNEPGGGTVIEIDGERLTSVAGYNIGYDSEGRPEVISGSYDRINIDYSRGTITPGGSDYDEDEVLNVKFNGKGYISELSSSWDYTEIEDGVKYQYKGSGKATFSYDKDGHISSVRVSSSDVERSQYGTYKYEDNIASDYTWEEGNLVKIEEEDIEIEDGDKEVDYETYEFDYGNNINTYKQMPWAYSDAFAFDDEMYVLASCGLFGVGPRMLPSYMTETNDYGSNYSRNISYTLNTYGALSVERIGNNTYRYGYGMVSRAFDTQKSDKKQSVRNLFVKRARK